MVWLIILFKLTKNFSRQKSERNGNMIVELNNVHIGSAILALLQYSYIVRAV